MPWLARHQFHICLLLMSCASALMTLALSRMAVGQTPPSGCTDISGVPPTFSGIQYGAAIQGFFGNFDGMGNACTDCHVAADQGPAGNLDLTAGVSWGNLVNVAADEDPSIMYVVPNHPEQSLLFRKINCDSPGVGSRMPYGFPSGTLTPEQMAAVYDWIAEGAPVGTTDGIFRDTFDFRGFEQ
jgi:hypothetical protein